MVRFALAIPTIFILLTMVFLLMRVAPGNPVTAALGGHVSPEVIQEISHKLGYDRPLYQQFGLYMWDILRGNFGTTITDKREVSTIILRKRRGDTGTDRRRDVRGAGRRRAGRA